MNRTSLTSRVSKLEAATRATGRVHTFFVRREDADRDDVQAEVDAKFRALIEAGEAGEDDLVVTFLTIYETEPADRPVPPLVGRTRAEFNAKVAEYATQVVSYAPPAAEQPRDLSRDRHGENGRHGSIMGASRAHPSIRH